MKKIASSIGFIAGGLVAAALPLVAFGQTNAGNAGTGVIYQAQSIVASGESLGTTVNSFLNIVIGVLITLAIIVFIWNVIKYVFLAKDDTERTNAKKYLFWSIIAIAVIIGVFGIAKLILATFGINGNNLQSSDIPTVPTVNSSY